MVILTAFATEAASQTVEHMVTDAQRFSRLPTSSGWYSLKEAHALAGDAEWHSRGSRGGQARSLRSVLTDTFAPIRFQVPNNSVSSRDWKMGVEDFFHHAAHLAFRPAAACEPKCSQDEKTALPRSTRVAGILPGSTPHDTLAEDFGMASVFAYFQPLSADSDVLADFRRGRKHGRDGAAPKPTPG